MPDMSAPARFDRLCLCASTLGISNRQVADRMQVSLMTLNRWRKGTHEPRTQDLEQSIETIKRMINDHIDEASALVEDC